MVRESTLKKPLRAGTLRKDFIPIIPVPLVFEGIPGATCTFIPDKAAPDAARPSR